MKSAIKDFSYSSHNSDTERSVLVGMIMNDAVLAQVVSRKSHVHFPSKYAKLVASWCSKHFAKHAHAPRRLIRGYFSEWAETAKDEDTLRLVESFLANLSEEYEASRWHTNGEINPARVMDQACKVFNKSAVTETAEQSIDLVQTGRVEEAVELMMKFQRVEVGAQSMADTTHDRGRMLSAFSEEVSPVFDYPGDLGMFLHHSMGPEDFVSFLAPEKTGKSWWLMDLTVRAVSNRKRVAYFEAGDMGERALYRRLAVRVSRRPIRSRDGRWPYSLDYPVGVSPPPQGGDGLATVDARTLTFDRPLSGQGALKAMEEFNRSKVKSEASFFKTQCHPTGTLSVEQMRGTLLDLQRHEDWTPDIVVVDYADILKHDGAKADDEQRAINKTWEALRRLSLEIKCLVVTATQANRDSYGRDLINRRHISQSKDKLAHVTGMIGLNVTAEEKKRGLMRLNWIGLREGESYSGAVCHVAGCLALGQPAVCSTF